MPIEHCTMLRINSKFIKTFSVIFHLLYSKNKIYFTDLVVSDCTTSLKLDSCCTKSYQIFAAYMALEINNKVNENLNEILELNNKQVKLDTEVGNNKIKLVCK